MIRMPATMYALSLRRFQSSCEIVIEKGAVEFYVAAVKPGRVLFEIAGVSEDVAREALRLAMHKLPLTCKIASKAELEGGDTK